MDWSAIAYYLDHFGDTADLETLPRDSVTDLETGHVHAFEVDPDVIDELGEEGELDITEIYEPL